MERAIDRDLQGSNRSSGAVSTGSGCVVVAVLLLGGVVATGAGLVEIVRHLV